MNRMSSKLIALSMAASMALAACGAAAPAAPTAAPAKPTEAPKPAAPTTAPAAPTAAPAKPTDVPKPAAPASLTYWGGLIFSDEANAMQEARVKEWGKAKGVNVTVVMINQNETVAKVSAAIEAGNMPDAFDLGRDFMLQLAKNARIEPVDDLYKTIGDAHGGWMDSTSKATNPKDFGGKIYGIPFGQSGNLLNRRDDVLSKAGYADAPKTWAELVEQAKKVNAPPKLFSMGFALSNVGDANVQNEVLRGYGGRIADDAGKKCTIDSPETREYMKWVTDAFAAGLFPPGATTWDGAGDNNAYQSGQAVFIANPGSVYLNILKADPELAKGSKYSALPGGPKLRTAPTGLNYRAISASSKNKDLAKDLLAFMSDDKYLSDYYGKAIYGPVLKNGINAPIFKSSVLHAGLLDLALNGTPSNFPDTDNLALAEYNTNFLTPKMVQQVVVDKKSVEDAIKATQAACQAIYDKYK